jgi:ribosomal-protein-alanine N-acetyltransferase
MIDAGNDTVDEALAILPLQPADVARLRLGWWSRVDSGELVRLLERGPGASVWMPATHEYAIVAPWRHRDSIAHLVDLVAVRHPVELTHAAIERAGEAGARLFLVIEASDRRQGSFYERVGLQLLETVLSYELALNRAISPPVRPGEIEHVVELTEALLADLVNIDANAFPWLWQNSEVEFRDYFGQPGVAIFLLREAGRPIGYLGITVFPGWGHIDRIAVRRDRQGRGYGRILTEFAISRLGALGAMRVGLTTQLRNTRSQSLYAGLGFRRQAASDYRMYGRPLWQNDSIDDLVAGN